MKKVIALFVIMIFSWVCFIAGIMHEIKSQGGIKNIIIEAGKEIKDIKTQIDEP